MDCELQSAICIIMLCQGSIFGLKAIFQGFAHDREA